MAVQKEQLKKWGLTEPWFIQSLLNLMVLVLLVIGLMVRAT